MAGLFNNKTGRQTFIGATSVVLHLMGKEMYSVQEGKNACTDTKGTIWLPPLPETATEEDKIKYFCSAVHEEGHNEHDSDTDLMSKVTLIHHYENCIDDIRIEYLQEQMYKGLVKYRKRFYEILADEFLRERFSTATIENLPAFLDTLGVYTIGKIKAEQMGFVIDWNPSEELTKAYNTYIFDLENKINNQKSFSDSLSIAHLIIERLKDLIKDAEEQKKEKGLGGNSERSDYRIDLDKLIEEISEQIEGIDLQSYVREQIDHNAEGIYYVGPDVKDIITENNVSSLSYVNGLKSAGIKILGPAGTKMTRYMINLSRMRSIHNNRSGKIDMLSFNSDVHDNRMNIFSREIPGSFEKAAVSICIDNSRSMRKIIEKAYSILAAILYYLDKANIPTEATGFTAQSCKNDNFRDTPVLLSIIKRYTEAFKGEAFQRCTPPQHLGVTSEVDCLKYAVPRLMQRKETKKILFVIGDGKPCLTNKKLTEKNSKAYKEYIELCKKAGIIVVGFGIECNLSYFFGDDYINVTSDNMGTEIANKLTDILNRKR
jgi:hypothetical protein